MDGCNIFSSHFSETNIFSLNKEHQQRPSNKQLGYEKNEEELTTSEEKHVRLKKRNLTAIKIHC